MLIFRVFTFVDDLKDGSGSVISKVLRAENLLSELLRSSLDIQHADYGVRTRLEIVLREDLLI